MNTTIPEWEIVREDKYVSVQRLEALNGFIYLTQIYGETKNTILHASTVFVPMRGR